MKTKHSFLFLLVLFASGSFAQQDVSKEQLARWLTRFPDADANGDGTLSLEEARAYRAKRSRTPRAADNAGRGAPRQFNVDPGWQAERFPDHAVCYRSPQEIATLHARLQPDIRNPVTSYTKPADGSLRIVGTGHSFMAPGYKSFPRIVRAAGFHQPPPLTHTGGGITGSARYKWEEENGIFQFDGQPKPKLLASIANAEWDAMMWGPYFQDQPAYYSCWIDFCLKYNPHMKFYLSDAWPQLDQLDTIPANEDALTAEVFVRMGQEKNAIYGGIVNALNKRYANRVFILPTCDAMVIAVQHYHRGELPGVDGIHTYVGGKERSLWRDRLGHLGPGFGQLEGYVFYATLYGRSPTLIEGDIRFGDSSAFPGRELDRAFRKIAWQAVLNNPLSGVKDHDGNGISDDRE